MGKKRAVWTILAWSRFRREICFLKTGPAARIFPTFPALICRLIITYGLFSDSCTFFQIVLYRFGGRAYNPPRRRREHGQHGQRLAAIFCSLASFDLAGSDLSVWNDCKNIRWGFYLYRLFFYIVNMEEMRRRRLTNLRWLLQTQNMYIAHPVFDLFFGIFRAPNVQLQIVYFTQIYDAGISSCCWMSQTCLWRDPNSQTSCHFLLAWCQTQLESLILAQNERWRQA